MHELHRQGLAIGALQDGDDLADGSKLEPEHAIEKYRTVVVGLVEAVGARIELGAILRGLEPERIQIGVERAADAVGADQHQGVNRIAGSLLHLGGGDFDAAALGPALELVADRPLDLAPIAHQRRDEIIARRLRPVRQRPGGAPRALEHLGGIVLEAAEEHLPLRIDRIGIGLVAGVEVVHVAGVAAVEKR